MSVTYGKKTLGVIDKQYALQSVTKGFVNQGFQLEFAENGTVTIQTLQTVGEVDYIPSGENRFGTMVELGNGTQDFVLRVDKAWTFSIDRKSSEDTVSALTMKNAVANQVRVVCIPNADKYIIATVAAYAVANSQTTSGTGSAITTSNSYQRFLQLGEYLTDALVENEDVIVLMKRTTLNLLKRNSEFKVACDKAYEDSKAGNVVPIDGMRIKVVPSSYLPANTNFLAIAVDVVAAPMKTNMTRVLDQVKGIDGSVAEGRRRMDALIATNRGKALVVDMAV